MSGCAAGAGDSNRGHVTPWVWETDLWAIGFYEVRRDEPAAGVRTCQVNGLGVLCGDHGLQIGYARTERIVADLVHEPSLSVRTASMHVALGAAAERAGPGMLGLPLQDNSLKGTP